MSNFPHSASIASSLSTSPFAVQSNLENLINRSRTHPHPRRTSIDSLRDHAHGHAHAHGQSPAESPTDETFDPIVSGNNASATPARRRQSAITQTPRVGTIQEASYEEALLFADDEDNEQEAGGGGTDERSKLLNNDWSRRNSRASRKSYGSTSAPLGEGRSRRIHAVEGMTAAGGRGGGGNSRSRSKARTPPRDGITHKRSNSNNRRSRRNSSSNTADSDQDQDQDSDRRRGREISSRPLSRTSSPFSNADHRHGQYHHIGGGGGGASARRESIAASVIRMGDDSSGDEGGDVARGLAATGGGAVFGVQAGMGNNAIGGGGLGVMDLDPVEELDAHDLELPTKADGTEVREWPEALRAEFPVILRLALPVLFTQFAEWSLVLASIVSIGHLGTTALAASSLASMTASVSCFSILQGLATALDTLLPAAWTSSDPSRVGLWTQRMSVVMVVSMLPMMLIWWNVEGILLLFGQDPSVSKQAGVYLRWFSIGMPGYAGNIVMKKYLQCQQLMHVPTYILFIVSPLNLLMNYLLVWGPPPVRLGFAGGALATALSYNLTFILSALWVYFYAPREAFHPVKFSHMFSKLGTVTSLGLAGTIMLSSEWWAWEAVALAASLLGPVNLAAQSVLLSTASTFFQIPASLGVASAVRVGNLLGAGRAWESKWASRACLFLSILFSFLNSAICMIFKNNWGYLFNSDPEVVHLVATVMPYIALFQVADGVAATAGAILRSLGLHTTGALINLTSYYIIGLPLGIWLAFSEKFSLGLVGLWIGLAVALSYASVLEGILVWRADWFRAVERVRERLGLPAQGEVGQDGKWVEGEGGYRDQDGDGQGEENGHVV